MVTQRPYSFLLRELEELLDGAWSDELAGKLEEAERKLGASRLKLRSLYELLEDWSEDLRKLALKLGKEEVP